MGFLSSRGDGSMNSDWICNRCRENRVFHHMQQCCDEFGSYKEESMANAQELEHIIHPIAPLYDEHSEILILGSFPSVKSREQMFFYGHKQNRYWRVMASLLGEELPQTIEEKRAMMLRHHIAMWDVIASCDIHGSSDSSIVNVVPNDLTPILAAGRIRQIYCNGAKSYELYHKYIEPTLGRGAVKLPSTSPANAAMSVERLLVEWKQKIF